VLGGACSIISTVSASRVTVRTLAVFVAASRSSGAPSPRLVTSIAESISSWPSCSSVQRSDAS